jgi:HAMP domain-containing protein
VGIKGDLVLIQRAVANRWLTEELKPKVIETLTSALSSGDPRAELRAAQIIISMEAQNQKDERKELKELYERILSIANQFGIDIPDVATIEATEVAAIGSVSAGEPASIED